MNDDTKTTPWWAAWPLQWPIAPQQLEQPINPGWAFGNVVTVNNLNSSAPDVERDVLARHSYGRQIGRLMDAVSALAEAAPATAADPRMKAFQQLAADVREIKRQAEAPRLERLKQELEALKRSDPEGWRKLGGMWRTDGRG